MHVLVIDEEPAIRSACSEIAASLGFVSHALGSLEAARSLLRGNSIDMLLIDQKAAMGDGFELLEEIKTLRPETAIVIMTALSTVSSAIDAMRSGASDYLIKPFAMEEITTVLQRAAQNRRLDSESRKLRERLRGQQGLGNIIGRSPEMEKLYRILSKVAQSTHPVLILGESGTGKELVAQSIHSNGHNASKPFIPVDCSSIVPTLMESELFGHVKGAFTGAIRAKDGLLVAAQGGTIFLDEIGELPLDLQSKLLRALQEKEIRPVGATHRVSINVRILAATNQDLATMVEQGRFRKDLYYRLNVVKLQMPSLRDRREDIPLLAAHFLERISREYRKPFRLSGDVVGLLTEYPWPGNVRELVNAMERACSFCSGEVIQLGDLPTELQDFHLHAFHAARPSRTPVSVSDSSAIVPLAQAERQAILMTLEQVKGDKLLAARLLGIGKTTLYRKLKEYGVAQA
jgi:two-component system response regulator HydG